LSSKAYRLHQLAANVGELGQPLGRQRWQELRLEIRKARYRRQIAIELLEALGETRVS